MKYFHKFLIASIISLHLVTAGTTGKLVGIVLDKASKKPLIGANVMIAGTGLGTSTDAEGRYFILQIPPKTYSVKFSMIGYKDVNVKNVKIQVDLTTTLNAEMEEGVIGMEHSKQGLTFGAGLNYQIPRGPRITIDYSYRSFGVFENIAGYSLNLIF